MAKKETCDFWIGHFQDSKDYFDFFGENSQFYKDDNDIGEKYISEFAKSQGETWIDHDFTESGFEDGKDSLNDKFKKYSYSDQWIPEVINRTDGISLKDINVIVFVTKGEIEKPTSVTNSKFSLIYIGQIEYDI
jgi:hypothetical protein